MLQILQYARVLGATAAGAAKIQCLLANRDVDVFIMDEAGEVLETHILESISQAVPPLST